MSQAEHRSHSFEVLRRFARRRSNADRCEMCSAELAPTHQHLLEPLNRKLICVIALYPSPAGATESLFSLDSWGDIVSGNPVLEEMEADVEALFVNRIGYFRCPAWPIARRLLSLPSTTFQEARRRF